MNNSNNPCVYSQKKLFEHFLVQFLTVTATTTCTIVSKTDNSYYNGSIKSCKGLDGVVDNVYSTRWARHVFSTASLNWCKTWTAIQWRKKLQSIFGTCKRPTLYGKFHSISAHNKKTCFPPMIKAPGAIKNFWEHFLLRGSHPVLHAYSRQSEHNTYERRHLERSVWKAKSPAFLFLHLGSSDSKRHLFTRIFSSFTKTSSRKIFQTTSEIFLYGHSPLPLCERPPQGTQNGLLPMVYSIHRKKELSWLSKE